MTNRETLRSLADAMARSLLPSQIDSLSRSPDDWTEQPLSHRPGGFHPAAAAFLARHGLIEQEWRGEQIPFVRYARKTELGKAVLTAASLRAIGEGL